MLRRVTGREPDHCFVTGSYRCGTTAVARWLGGQPGATGFSESRALVAAHAMLGEVDRFRQLHRDEEGLTADLRRLVLDHYARRRGGTTPSLVVDKEPLGPIELPDRRYAPFVDDVRRIFPRGKVIVMTRDPVAAIWSMTRRDYGYSLTDRRLRRYPLGEHVDNWLAGADLALDLHRDPEVLVCSFDRLTAEPGPESRRIADHLGRPLSRFEPRPTQEPAFAPDELALVRDRTAGRVAALAAAGLTRPDGSAAAPVTVATATGRP